MSGIIFWLCVVFILYTYFIYPALLVVFAWLKPSEDKGSTPSDDQLPTVTLLISAYNEKDHIGQKLENSLALKYPKDKLQILVNDDGSDDGTAQAVEGYKNKGIELHAQSRRQGKLAAIKMAVQAARGDILVFSDTNNHYPEDNIRHLVAPFADPEVGAVSGSRRVIGSDGDLGKSESLYWRYESLIKECESRLSSCTAVSGTIFAIRRELFESPPPSFINDDFIIGMRLVRSGYRMVYTPEAKSFDRVSPSAGGEIERRTRIIAGRYQAIAHMFYWLPYRNPLVVWQVISHKLFRPLVPLAMIGAFAANILALLSSSHSVPPLLALSHPYGAIALSLQLLFYLSAIIGHYLNQMGKSVNLFYLPSYLFYSNWAALKGLVRFLFNSQSTTWKRVPRPSVPARESVEK